LSQREELLASSETVVVVLLLVYVHTSFIRSCSLTTYDNDGNNSHTYQTNQDIILFVHLFHDSSRWGCFGFAFYRRLSWVYSSVFLTDNNVNNTISWWAIILCYNR
jgi:hypothetical protein